MEDVLTTLSIRSLRRSIAYVVLLIPLAFLHVLILPESVKAQPVTGAFGGAVVGFGQGTMGAGDSSDSATGLILGAEFGSSRDGFRRWYLDAAAQLFKVPSPIIDEQYRAVSLMVHRSFGRRLFLAPSLGFEFRSWSGSEAAESSDTDLAIGASVGTVLRLGDRLRLVPEARWQFSVIDFEGSFDSRLLAIRLAVLRVPS